MGLEFVGEGFEDTKKGLSGEDFVEESEHRLNERKGIEKFARVLDRWNAEFFAIFGSQGGPVKSMDKSMWTYLKEVHICVWPNLFENFFFQMSLD
jgi:hypothetical protein